MRVSVVSSTSVCNRLSRNSDDIRFLAPCAHCAGAKYGVSDNMEFFCLHWFISTHSWYSFIMFAMDSVFYCIMPLQSNGLPRRDSVNVLPDRMNTFS